MTAGLFKNYIIALCLLMPSVVYAQVNTGAGIPLEFQIDGTTEMTLRTDGILTTEKAVIIGTTVTCDGSIEGALRYNSTTKKIELCDGTDWGEIASQGGVSSDQTPNAFNFTDLTEQSLGALVLSNILTISGFDGPLIAEVSGAGTPEIQINGGPWVSASAINPGDTLRVRLVSSTSINAAYVPTVTVGTVSDNWSVTTRAAALKVFITAGTYNGSGIGGLSGGDTICQNEAAVKGYAGSYKAILSDDTTDAKDRLTLSYPIARAIDDVTVEAINLWGGSIDAAISTLGGSRWAWTGTNTDGTKNNTCSSWTSTATTGGTGHHIYTTSGWVIYGTDWDCADSRYIYCIQQ